MNDLISRQAAIDELNERQRELIYCFGVENDMVKIMDVAKSVVIAMPSAQPQQVTGKLNSDCISRHHVEIKLKELVNEMEEIFSHIREKNVDDSVCGLCEYDCDHGLDGYANECPGFEKDDCFKLKEKYRSEWISTKDLPSAQPERKSVTINADPNEIKVTNCNYKDTIYRQAVLDGIEELKRSPWYQGEGYAVRKDAVEIVEQLCVKNIPSAQPERKKGKWIGEERQRLIDETDDGCVYMTDTWWYCSECGNSKGYVGHKPEDKYCNECGADMRGEQYEP